MVADITCGQILTPSSFFSDTVDSKHVRRLFGALCSFYQKEKFQKGELVS